MRLSKSVRKEVIRKKVKIGSLPDNEALCGTEICSRREVEEPKFAFRVERSSKLGPLPALRGTGT